MGKMRQILGFEIDVNQVPIEDITGKSKTLSPKRKSFFLRRCDTESEFLILLYHLIFIERLEKSEVSRILGYKNAASLHRLLYDLGWYTEQVNSRILEDAKEFSKSLDILDPEHRKLELALRKAVELNEKTYQKLGFQSGEECARAFYYLTYIKGLSAIQISHLINSTWLMTEHHSTVRFTKHVNT